MRWLALFVVALGACDKPEPAVVAKPACFVDEIPTRMTNRWHVRRECTPDNLGCRWLCLRGDEDACFNRAIAIERTNGAEATELFAEACRLGLALGCTNWAAHQWSDDRGDQRCVEHVFSKACAFREPLSCGMVGRMTLGRAKTPSEVARGKKQLESACDEYGGMPCRMLAMYMEQGMFGTADSAKLDALMTRACEGGDDPACGKHETVGETFWSPESKH